MKHWALHAPIVLCLYLASIPSAAADWPQILGPHRDGQALDESLFDRWPDDGPELKWEVDIGEGFAGPAIADDKVILFDRMRDEDRVTAYRLESGDQIWQTGFTTDYRARINPDTGPRCVPVIHDGRVYVFGASGDLRCLDLSTGDEIWSRDAYADFRGDEGYFGAGSTPIVVGDRVLVNVGGRRTEAGIVAFDARNGETIWKTGEYQASYSSPIALEMGDRQAVFFVTRLTAVALDSADGSEIFSFRFGLSGPTVNAATPLLCDGKLFLSASYGIGSRVDRIVNGRPEAVWANDSSMSSQYATCVYRDGFLYGTHGREDGALPSLRCIDIDTGEIKWSQDSFGVAHLIASGDDLLIVKTDGTAILSKADPGRFVERATAQLSPEESRALPALSDGLLLVRSNATRRRAKLRCFVVGE